MSDARWGLMLLNLGTPDSPAVADVRRFLRQFLSDPRVIDINPIGRWFLLNLVILPFRPKASAHAYRQIWTERGSPLLYHTQDLAEGVRRQLGDGVKVEVAMRYGNPSIDVALDRFRNAGVDRIAVLPLFPQYAASTTGSALAEVFSRAAERWNTPPIVSLGAFFDHPAFVEAFRKIAAPVLQDFAPDHVLMSFHGLPERQLAKSDESGRARCLRADDCCATLRDANRGCYRAQCYATARGLAATLGLEEGRWEVAFQSRLGRDPWIRPYTDERIRALATEGKKRLAVLCPAFVADCLETLEEIGLRADEDFRRHGGMLLKLVPSLNADPAWIEAVAQIARESVPSGWA